MKCIYGVKEVQRSEISDYAQGYHYKGEDTSNHRLLYDDKNVINVERTDDGYKIDLHGETLAMTRYMTDIVTRAKKLNRKSPIFYRGQRVNPEIVEVLDRSIIFRIRYRNIPGKYAKKYYAIDTVIDGNISKEVRVYGIDDPRAVRSLRDFIVKTLVEYGAKKGERKYTFFHGRQKHRLDELANIYDEASYVDFTAVKQVFNTDHLEEAIKERHEEHKNEMKQKQ